MSCDFDAVGAFSGSWRAGGYMKMVHTPHTAKPQIRATHPYTVFNLYAQTISLNKLNFFGLGNDSPLAGKSLFGMSERIVGASDQTRVRMGSYSVVESRAAGRN